MDNAMMSGKLPVIAEKSMAQDQIKLGSDSSVSNSNHGANGIGKRTCSDHWQGVASRSTKDNTSSWERGILTINSVLEPGSTSREALTPEQASGLEALRNMLLYGTAQEQDMVPKAILDTAENGDSVSAFLAMEFGGVETKKIKQKGLDVFRNSVRKITNANRFLGGLNAAILEQKALRKPPENYLPPEYQALSPDAKGTLRSMLSWESLKKWDYNIFKVSEICGEHQLLFIGWAVLCSPYAQLAMEEDAGNTPPEGEAKESGYDFIGSFSVSPSTICEFLRSIESDYLNTNPYHNSTHAADIVQTTHTLLQLGVNKFTTDILQEYSLLIAAAVHDIGHPGKNNNYQVNARTEVAIRYNDSAVLENMHVSRMFSRIVGPNCEQKINVFGELTDDQFTSARTSIIRTVIDTDMARHFRNVSKLKGYIAELDGCIEPEKWQEKDDGKPATKLLQFALHLADISNPAKPPPVFEEWTNRVLEEFFAQGDAERKENLPISPLCDRCNTSRADSQIGFIKFVVKPAFELLEQIIPGAAKQILSQINSNLDFWEKKQEEEECSEKFP